jgi:hypothetical protein
MLSVNYTDMTAHLLGAVQALTQKCRWLESRLDGNTDLADVARLPSSMLEQFEKNRDNIFNRVKNGWMDYGKNYFVC